MAKTTEEDGILALSRAETLNCVSTAQASIVLPSSSEWRKRLTAVLT